MGLKENFTKDTTAFGGLPIYIVTTFLAFVLGKSALALQLVLGVVLCYAIAVVIRAFYFKKRPNPEAHRNWLQKIDVSSFPSLHAMRAALLAVLLGRFFSMTALTVLFGIVVLSVAWTRMSMKKHDLIDVVAGVITGLIIGFAVLRIF